MRVWTDKFGLATNVLAAVRDDSGNVIARLNQTSGNINAQYWDGSAFQTAAGTATNEADTTLTEYTFHVKKGSGTGSIALYRAGALVQEVTDITLTSFGAIADVVLGYNGTRYRGFSEVVVSTEPTIGWGVLTVPPSAEGVDTGGTGTYADVDEVVLSTADYIAFDTAGQKHSFKHAAIEVANFVKSVTVTAHARVVDGDGPQSMRPYVVVGGTRYYGDTVALATSWEDYQHSWEVNPATSVQWSPEEVNDAALEKGWEAVA